MQKKFKIIRHWLKTCQPNEFDAFSDVLRLTPRQRQIFKWRFDSNEDRSIVWIADHLNLAIDSVNKEIATIYRECARKIYIFL